MTEPVAYIYEDHVFKTEKETVLFKKEFDRYKHDNMLKHVILPLFTADEISDIYKQNKRVKMTQAEFDEFKNLFEVVDYSSIALATIQHVKDDFNKLGLKVYSGTVNERIKKENEFNVLWANYDPDNPEETIEVVPNKKWFVRSKEKYQGFYMFLGNLNELRDPWIFTKQDNFTSFATKFDTKEEAEEWTNPLTKAVHLPVEDK